MTRAILIDGFWSGEISEIELTRLGLMAGMTLNEISEVISDVHDEDGTAYSAQLDSVRRAMA